MGRRALVLAISVIGLGCVGVREEVGEMFTTPTPGADLASPQELPRELNKINLQDYIIEPPDVLLINAIRIVPKPPYRIGPLDTMLIQARAPLTPGELAGEYVVEPDGRVNLGPRYGSVPVSGLTVDEARTAVEKQLKELLADPTVYVAPLRTQPLQQIAGEHLVRPDGQVSLGSYGLVRVCGMTTTQAKQAVEAHLRQYLQDPEVAIDVMSFNSKLYYVIFDGGGAGQQVYRLPVTGNETVLDAIGQVNGLSPVSSKHHIWVARPAPSDCGPQILPVDWVGISTRGTTDTNYQIFPGDRIYVKANVMVTVDTFLARFLSPMERVLGFTLLGSGVVRDLQLYPASRFASGGVGGGAP
jgi:polysaccharide export outer membrane protein